MSRGDEGRRVHRVCLIFRGVTDSLSGWIPRCRVRQLYAAKRGRQKGRRVTPERLCPLFALRCPAIGLPSRQLMAAGSPTARLTGSR